MNYYTFYSQVLHKIAVDIFGDFIDVWNIKNPFKNVY